MKPVRCLAILILTMVFYSCNTRFKPAFTGHTGTGEAFTERNIIIDSALRILRNGDLLLRTGNDVTSYMFSRMNKKDKTYSHCGLVRLENGYPFVYHAIGGEDNPDELLRRDSVHTWLSPETNEGFAIGRYALRPHEFLALDSCILDYYRKRPRFDMKFDLGTEEKLYCAEFVYKVLKTSLQRPCFVPVEQLAGRNYVSIENLYLNRSTSLIWQVRYK